MNEFSSKKPRSTSPSHSSLTEVQDEERDVLLETVPSGERSSGESRPRRARCTCSSNTICMLSIITLAFVIALFTIILQMKTLESTRLPPWIPPEQYETRVFEHVDVYGEEPGPKSETAWTNLIPSKLVHSSGLLQSCVADNSSTCSAVGKGWIEVHNETAIPDTPGFNQSLPEQSALVSVFHQLHCLVSTAHKRTGDNIATNVRASVYSPRGIFLRQVWQFG